MTFQVFFQFLGMLILSGFILIVGWSFFMGALFNNIGGNGKWYEVVICILIAACCFFGIFGMWSKLSPLKIVLVTA